MLVKLSDLFTIEYPKTMIFSNQEVSKNGINFVSSSGENNGVVGKIKETAKYKKYRGGAITVPLKGSVLSAHYQQEDFYIAHQIAVLYPKTRMSMQKMMYYCVCIRKNRYRYNYGRQADLSLRDLMVPADMPSELETLNVHEPKSSPILLEKVSLDHVGWKWFRYDELFEIRKGKRLKKESMTAGNTPFIGSTETHNGVTEHIDRPPIHDGNVISVTYNGSVGEAFYQPEPFWASDDVNVFYPKFELNIHRAIFLITLIRKEKYRFNYGRKWHTERMLETKIKLPVMPSGKPDWQLMENFIKGLRYSDSLSPI